MGMEGMLKQVSEFELASYRKSPEEFYSGLMGSYDLESLGDFGKEVEPSSGVPAGSKDSTACARWIEPASG